MHVHREAGGGEAEPEEHDDGGVESCVYGLGFVVGLGLRLRGLGA